MHKTKRLKSKWLLRNQEINLVELKRVEMYVYGVQVMQALVKYMCSLYPVTV